MAHAEREYLPAAGRHGHLSLYDPFVKLLGFDKARRVLLEQAAIGLKHRVLDIGCGTGTLVTVVKQLHPNAEVVGLDPDPNILKRARHKAERAGMKVRFDEGFGDSLPYPAESFDRAFSSFMFHHLPLDQQEPTLREVRRVLAPGGSLHLLDFGGPCVRVGWLDRILHANDHLKHNAQERILEMMKRAGFADARVVTERKVVGLVRVVYYRAV